MAGEIPNQCAVTVAAEEAGERLDRLFARHVGALSRSRLKELIKSGHASVDGRKIEEPNYRVKQGEQAVLEIPPPEPAEPRGEPIPLAIVYEDDHLIVIDKPAGMVVHPAAGNWTGTLVNALIAHCGDSLSGIGGVRRPGIVHRLDKDTSGLIVVAKTDVAHQGLAAQFAAHGADGRLDRTYIAVVWGVPEPRRGIIDAPLARSETNRTRIAVARRGGRRAVTRYEVVDHLPQGAREPVASIVRCRLMTGRTHQIRVHMAHIRHPLLGDTAYGAGFAASAARLPEAAQEALRRLGRQALHATVLGFEHPVTGEQMRFESPLPADLQALIDACRGA